MLNLKTFVFAFFGLIAVASTPILSLGQHPHKSPHGGIVQEADGIHAEFLLDKTGEPRVYFYDRSMKPLERRDLEAKLTVKGHGGVDHSGTLSFSKDSKGGAYYKGEPIKDLKEWDSVVVSVKLKDRWTEIRFSNHSKGKAGH